MKLSRWRVPAHGVVLLQKFLKGKCGILTPAIIVEDQTGLRVPLSKRNSKGCVDQMGAVVLGYFVSNLFAGIRSMMAQMYSFFADHKLGDIAALEYIATRSLEVNRLRDWLDSHES